MPYLFINQSNTIDTTDSGSLPATDTYADAILRTFASLQPLCSPTLCTSQKHNPSLSTLKDNSLDKQFLRKELFSSSSSSSSSIDENQFIFQARLPFTSKRNKRLKKLQTSLSHLDQVNTKKEMSTKTLLPSASHINDRYFFHSTSSTKHEFDHSSPESGRKRYKFSSIDTDQSNHDVYNFSSNNLEQRSRSLDSDRYYFPTHHLNRNSQPTVTHVRADNSAQQRSMRLMGETSTILSDTPYLFSTTTTESQRYPSTTSTFIRPDDTWTYQRQYPQIISNSTLDFPPCASTMNSSYRPSTRLDTVTSTNGSLSLLKQSLADKSTTVHFQRSSTVRSYLTEARERLSGRRRPQSPESFEKSVDRLVLSVNKKYGHQHQIPSSFATATTSSSLDYISQYYAKEEEQGTDYPQENTSEQQQLHSSLNTNRIHTQIMKNVNKSLLDRNYQIEQNRVRHLEQNVRRYFRLYENQALHRELNYNLIRCFSSSYLEDFRREDFRRNHIQKNFYSYTYEDIQDIYVPSKFEVYKMKTTIDREKHQRLSSSVTTGQLSPASSSAYSPNMIGSLNENMDTQIGTFEIDQKSYAWTSQTPAHTRLSVDVFYEIMQESFRGVDASIAGHISKASQYTKQKLHPSPIKTRDYESDIDIKSNSSFWSDEDDVQHFEETYPRKSIPHQRKISRYLSTVNRSLLDRPSDLIADFYLSQLNRNMQDSVRHIEIIARDKAYRQQTIDGIKTTLHRSLSAEHLYQVRKEHLRYKQSFHAPTSFTTEDVADIYKPSILENYKRKIAIELERRRRQRQGQYIAGSFSPPIYTSEIESGTNVIKSSHSPSIGHRHHQRSHTRHDFAVVSPPAIVQTEEIVMGRARRTLTADGSDHIVRHIGATCPPSIYSDVPQLSLPPPPPVQTRLALTATIHDRYDSPYVIDVDLLDLIDKQQMWLRQERDHIDDMIDGTVHTSRQIIALHPPGNIPRRSQTKIYIDNPPAEPIEICQANLIEPDVHHLSFVNINQNIPLQQAQPLVIPSNNYQHAAIITSSPPPLSLPDQSYDEQVTQYTIRQPNYQHSTLILPSRNEHIAKVQQDIPVFEVVRSANLSTPSTSNVNEVFNDNAHFLYTPQINEQPIVLNSSHVNQVEHLYENYVVETELQLDDDVYQPEQTMNMEEQLSEIEKTTVQMEFSYVTSFIQLPVNHPRPLASLLAELTPAVRRQHATQIIDNNHHRKSYEKVQENIHMPIIVYDTEWKDENVQSIPNEWYSNLQTAEHKYSDPIAYERIQINRPEQWTMELSGNTLEIETDEQIISLANEFDLIQHEQQQLSVHVDEVPSLENPLRPTTILTLNYAHHNQKPSEKTIRQREAILKHDDDLSSISSFLDMEMFLNHFEESLDHEQHLPLIDQISLSYATSFAGRYEHKTRSLPTEWFQPTILSHDEPLVEQWTVVKDIDTIQQEGTLHRQQLDITTNIQCENVSIVTNTDAFCMNQSFDEALSESSTLTDNQQVSDSVSRCSSTSDCQIDSVDKDNDTATYIFSSTVIIPTSTTNLLPSSSITTTTLLSQSSPPLRSSAAPIVPITYFLDALAVEQDDRHNPTKDFLLTIGFGQRKMNTTMNEIANTVSTIDQPSRPTWVNRRPLENNIITLPTIIHHEKETLLPATEQKLSFATENQLEENDIAFVLHPHRLQHGYDLGENIQAPLSTFFESSHLHLPIVNEVYIYQMSFHHDFPLFHPPDLLPHILVGKTREDHVLSPSNYQIKQSKIFSFAQIHHLFDHEQDIQTMSCKLDQPTYIEHCYIQPLYPFSEVCHAQINQADIINNNDMNFLSNILLTKLVKNKDEYELNRFDRMDQTTDNNRLENNYGQLDLLPTTATVGGKIAKQVVFRQSCADEAVETLE